MGQKVRYTYNAYMDPRVITSALARDIPGNTHTPNGRPRLILLFDLCALSITPLLNYVFEETPTSIVVGTKRSGDITFGVEVYEDATIR